LKKNILEGYRRAVDIIVEALKANLGGKLISIILYGSTARGDVSEDSDIDLLIVLENLSESRLERIRIFDEVEKRCERELKSVENEYNIKIFFSPILKTVDEARKITPLYLDMVEDGIILFDRDDFMKKTIDRVRARLRELGARRIWRGRRWYWVLKPEVKVGEVLEIE
jgi:predicted nucleotidyltransferase